MEKLKAFSIQLDGNLKTLQQQNEELTQRFLALQQDRETVRLEARNLGYWSNSETVWKIPGKTVDELGLPAARIMNYDFDQNYRDDFFRWMFLLIALASYLIISFLDQRESPGTARKSREPARAFKSAGAP